MNKRNLHVVIDGDFMTTHGVPSSNRSHYDIFASRYVPYFKHVFLYCRVQKKEDKNAMPVGGEGVTVISLPDVHGPIGLVKNIISILKVFLKASSDKNDRALIRVPGIFPTIAWAVFSIRGFPYAVEAMADAEAQFSKQAFQKRGRLIYKIIWVNAMKLQCRLAKASAYVTKKALQEKFPPGKGKFTCSFTTLDLPESFISEKPKDADYFKKRPFKIVNVAMMQKHLKGQDIIIKAFAEFSKNKDVELVLVGDGDTRVEFENLAADLCISDKVKFLGRKSAGIEIFSVLDESHIFVLPSRQEGLPRVVIEAMARGLPCIASDLPGNFELLDNEFIVKDNSVEGWRIILERVWSDCDLLASLSTNNIEKARYYSLPKVKIIREKFYGYINESA